MIYFAENANNAKSMDSLNFFERACRRRAGMDSLLDRIEARMDAAVVGAPEGGSTVSKPSFNGGSALQRLRQRAASEAQADRPKESLLPSTPAAMATTAAPAPKASGGSILDRLRAKAAQETFETPELGAADDEESFGAASPARATARADDEQTRIVEGVLVALRLYNEWGLATLRDEEGRDQRLTGAALVSLKEGLSYRVHGIERVHPQHGPSLEVVSTEPMLDVDEDSLRRYLVKHFQGVGNAKASRYLQSLKDSGRADALQRLRDVLLHEPWKLDVAAVLAGEPSIEVDDAFAAPRQEEGDETFDEAADQARIKAAVERARQEALAEVLKRNFMLRLGGISSFKDPAAKALARFYSPLVATAADPVQAAWARLVADPYEPIEGASGYGFATADLIASRLGMPQNAPQRLRALGPWIVDQACARSGHTWLASRDFVAEIRRSHPALKPQDILMESVKAARLVVEPEQGRIYLPRLWNAERRLANAIAERLAGFEPMTSRSYEEVVEHLRKNAHKINPAFAEKGLDEAQLHAVAAMVTAPTGIHVLRGGPGTGKTTIVECMTWLLKRRKEFLFAAPTGKAAKVLSNRVRSVGAHASTICSLLRGTDEAGYEHHAANPLECDVLVIDETTMVGVQTADALLQAAPKDAHIIFLGDPGRIAQAGQSARAGQLPSIAPGRFMHDLQVIDGVQSLELTRVWRNGGGILDVVEEVARGRLEVADRESVTFAPLPNPETALQTVLARYLELARRDGLANTVLIMPKRAGDVNTPGWNVTWANSVLREVLNRDGQKMPGTVFRLGDRIIVRQNMRVEQPAADDLRGKGPQLDAAQVRRAAGIAEIDQDDEGLGEEGDGVRLVNGDTGFIVGWRMNEDNARLGLPQWVRLQLDDGRLAWIPGEEVGVLDHAYALTVHAVQGSEYRNVLVCATDGHAQFMNANMLLTAFSRAKGLLQVWGDERVLQRVAATPLPARNSALPERVANAAPEDDAQHERVQASETAESPNP